MDSIVPAVSASIVPGDHVALVVLRHLAGDEDVVAGAHRRMERQVRVLLADRINVVAAFAHDCSSLASSFGFSYRADASMMSTPLTRSTR